MLSYKVLYYLLKPVFKIPIKVLVLELIQNRFITQFWSIYETIAANEK